MLAALQGRPKVADKLIIHGTTDFRSLCEKVLTPETKYLVLDLDRTVHFGHNVGELLGWELSAYEAYGEPYLAMSAERTDRNRFFASGWHPVGLLNYAGVAMRRWLIPGIYYFLYVKLAAKVPALRRLVFRWFGLDPVDAVQGMMRDTLLAQLASVPLPVARDLVRSIWKRLAPDQVVMREDIEYLRTRYPNLKVIVSSGSPQPVLEVAQEELGVDAVLFTQVEEHEGYLSMPHEVGWRASRPRRLSPPSRTKHNASVRKIEGLLACFPDFAASETVGMSDTSYGEDHVWAHHFTKVVDINSPTPYAPIVPASSPLREVHSATVLTQSEIEAGRLGGEVKRGRNLWPALAFEGAELQESLRASMEAIRTLSETYRRQWEAAMQRHEKVASKMADLLREVEREVEAYNASWGMAREVAMRNLQKAMRNLNVLRQGAIEAERPFAEMAFKLSITLEQSRRQLLRPQNKRRAA